MLLTHLRSSKESRAEQGWRNRRVGYMLRGTEQDGAHEALGRIAMTYFRGISIYLFLKTMSSKETLERMTKDGGEKRIRM